MTGPESLVLLAGFAFAHAAWSVSDLPKGDLRVPLAVVEKSGQRQLLRFEADTQEKAISRGKITLAENEETLDAWAFVREGQILESGHYVDVLTVEAKAQGMPESVTFVQRFQPFSRGQFKLLGETLVAIGSKQISPETATRLRAQLQAGVQSHGKAAALWKQWSTP